jgi:tetratricopeptide (TPR) repeat protein
MSSAAFVVLISVQVAVLYAYAQADSAPGPKAQFATSLMQFEGALTGTYGDEGVLVRSSLQGMQQALAQWDGSISAYEAQVTAEMRDAAPGRAADTHRTLGILYLDRGRVADAARELAAAVELDPARADVWFLLGVIEGQRNQPSEAVRALRSSLRLDATKPITSYLLTSQLLKIGELEGATRARQGFLDVRRTTLARPPPARPVAAPFVQWGLLPATTDAAPRFAPARYAEGFELVKQGRYKEATTRFEETAATDPLTADVATVPARMSQGIAAFKQGRLPAALAHLQATIITAPNNGEAHRILGTIYWANGQPAEAVAQLETVIRLNPRDERARLALADALVAQGRFADAERTLQAAIRAIPGSGQAHYQLGKVSEAMDKPSDALRALEAAVKLTPVTGTDALYQAIGAMHSIDRHFEAVIAAHTERVDLSPNNADAHIALGEAYLKVDRGSEAQVEFLAALMIDPRRTDAYAPLGRAYLRMGDYADAEVAARRAVELDPTQVEARYTLATSLVRLGRTDDGTRELERYRQMQADAEASQRREYEVAALMRAVAQSIGRRAYEEAAARLRDIIRLKPTDPGLYDSLGLVLGNAGRLADAIEAFERALTLNGDPEVHRHLANAYTASGRPGDAQRHREQYDTLRKTGRRP